MQPLKKELCLNKKYSLKFPDLDQEKTDQIKKTSSRIRPSIWCKLSILSVQFLILNGHTDMLVGQHSLSSSASNSAFPLIQYKQKQSHKIIKTFCCNFQLFYNSCHIFLGFKLLYINLFLSKKTSGVSTIILNTTWFHRNIRHKQDVKCDTLVLNVMNLYFLVPVVKKKLFFLLQFFFSNKYGWITVNTFLGI